MQPNGLSVVLLTSCPLLFLVESDKFDISKFSLEQEKTNVFVFHLLPASSRFVFLLIREIKHHVNGRWQTAKITSDFEFFSSNP